MTGHGYYVRGLLEGFRQVSDVDVIELSPPDDRDLDTVRRFLWDQIRFPAMARRAGADLIHSTCFSVPRRFSGPKVATIHDLSLKKFPSNMTGFSGWFLREYVPSTYKRADRVIAISGATKEDAVQLLELDARRIDVIHEAASKFYGPSSAEEKSSTFEEFELLEGRYVLFVGTLEPRKNLAFLVRSMAPVLQQDRSARLVVAGKMGWQADDLAEEVSRQGIEDQVIRTGYVSDEQKRALYTGAAALAFPSMYEGFGLPPVEAAACGCPVVVADNSSLPEVVGDGGWVLELKEGLWTDVLGRLLSDPVQRENGARRALARSEDFSWERTAKETTRVYRMALG